MLHYNLGTNAVFVVDAGNNADSLSHMPATKEPPTKEPPAFVSTKVSRAVYEQIAEMARVDRRTISATIEIIVEHESERREQDSRADAAAKSVTAPG